MSEYNGTRLNERAVEVAVGLALLGQATDGECSVLEVGAVLPHYRAGWPADGHTVIDLHEEYPGVINADVLTWEPPAQVAASRWPLAQGAPAGAESSGQQLTAYSQQPSRSEFDLIVCISTLDHLQSLTEFIKALERLNSWLAPGGLLFVTLPFGQPAHVGGGAWLELFLRATDAGFWTTELTPPQVVWRLDKTDPAHHLWTQILEDAPHLGYNGRAPCANTVYMLLWGDVERWWLV